MASRIRKLNLPLLFLCAAGTVPCEVFASDSMTVYKAWRDREMTTTSLSCHWTETYVLGKGTESVFDPKTKTRTTIPRSDLSFSRSCKAHLQGMEKIRFEFEGLQLVYGLMSFQRRTFVDVTNGREFKRFFSGDGVEESYAPDGYIDDEFGSAPGIELRAILLTYRPSLLGEEYDLQRFGYKGSVP